MAKRQLLKLLPLFVAMFMIVLPATARADLTPDQYAALHEGAIYFNTEVCDNGQTVVSINGKDNEQKIWNYFISQKLSDPQVAGIMGNLEQESSFDPERVQGGGDSQNPSAAGSGGWGLVQWTPGAKATDVYNQYKSKYSITAPIYQLEAQLPMIWAQMNDVSPLGVNNMVNGLKQLSDVDAAAKYFDQKFEGGTDPLLPSGKGIREFDAEQILTKYGGTSGSNSGSLGPCSNPTTNGACKVTKPVYNGQYSIDQLKQIFGDPGTAANHPGLHLVTVKFFGFSTLASPLVAPCLEAVAQQLQSEHTTYKVRLFGCYRFDSNNGSSNIGLASYHTYGAACDINWDTNPFVESGAPTAHDMPQQWVQAFHDHGFTWGGDWTQPKDYMHFEWHGVVPK